MILLLMRNQETIELPGGNDAIHKSEWLICLDAKGFTLGSFRTSEVLGYSMNPRVADHLRSESNLDGEVDELLALEQLPSEPKLHVVWFDSPPKR